MRCDRNVTLVHSKTAVMSSIFDILRQIPGIGRANIHDGTEGTKRHFFFFYGGHRLICGGVIITLTIEFVYTHWIYLLIFLVKIGFIAIGTKEESFCPGWGSAHLFADGIEGYTWVGFNNEFIVNMHYDGAMAKGFH